MTFTDFKYLDRVIRRLALVLLVSSAISFSVGIAFGWLITKYWFSGTINHDRLVIAMSTPGAGEQIPGHTHALKILLVYFISPDSLYSGSGLFYDLFYGKP